MQNFLNSELTPEKVEAKGQKLHRLSKIGMLIGLCGIALFVIIGLISIATGASFIAPMIFHVYHGYEFSYFFVVIDYLALILGIVGCSVYFRSLELYALGKIAVNTEK